MCAKHDLGPGGGARERPAQHGSQDNQEACDWRVDSYWQARPTDRKAAAGSRDLKASSRVPTPGAGGTNQPDGSVR
jgi:hypothetical protein